MSGAETARRRIVQRRIGGAETAAPKSPSPRKSIPFRLRNSLTPVNNRFQMAYHRPSCAPTNTCVSGKFFFEMNFSEPFLKPEIGSLQKK